MRRIVWLISATIFAGAALGADLDLTYRVKVDNLTGDDVTFMLDGGKACLARPQASCSWDIGYGSHSLEATAGGKHYRHDFELSDESDIQVHCGFDGAKFGGDSC